MVKRDEQRLLTALIDYFESGTREADAAAKAILAADGDFDTYWRAEIERFQKSVLWTGLRGPEAELLATGLRQATGLVVDGR